MFKTIGAAAAATSAMATQIQIQSESEGDWGAYKPKTQGGSWYPNSK